MSHLAGRQAELAVVERFLDQVPAGPVGLAISGDPGIGKTEIWLEAIRRAANRGFFVLRARPAEPERQLSFAGLGDLLRGVIPGAEDSLPGPQREALLAALLRTPTRSVVDPRAIATGISTLLSTFAEEQPVVVAIDDLQWLDRASERALEFALRRLPSRAALLVTLRTDAQDLAQAITAALGRAAVTELRIGQLPVEALQEVIEGAGMLPSRTTVARLAAASGGNPFYALELARALGDVEAAPGEPLPVPPALSKLVEDRIERLSPTAHEIAALVAASFRPTGDAIRSTFGAGSDVDAALIEAEEAGVLAWDGERIRFTHPLLGSALYGSLSVGRRRALHRRLATVTTDPEERAHHLVGATVGEDEDAAGEIETAAALAADRGAADVAAELYRVAERRTPRTHADARARRLVSAAEALSTAGDFQAARSLAQASRAVAGSGPLRARAWLTEASIATYFGSIEEQTTALDAALAEAGDEPSMRMQALLALAGKIAIDPAGAAQFAEEAVRVARASGDTASLRRALTHAVVASGIVGLGYRRDLFDEAVVLEAQAPAFGVDLLIWSHWLDDAEETRERNEQQLRIARERGDSFARAEIAEFLAMVDFRAGNWNVAEASLEAACSTLEPFGISGPVIASFADRSLIDAHRGRLDRARATLRDILQATPAPDPFWTAVTLSASGAVEFVAGDLRATDAAWTAMRRAIGSVGWRDFLEDRSEPDHVETLLALGDRGRAGEILEHLEWRGRTLPRPWIDATLPRPRALLMAADGDLDGAIAALEGAGDDAAFPFERARNRMVKGQLERRANRKLAARRSLEEALQVFDWLGSPPWVDRARTEIGRLGLRHGSPHELTAMERRIAELAATGLTNRQVADAAFVSPKTVEANLARVYGKLGIRSRAELGARMGAPAAAADGEVPDET